MNRENEIKRCGWEGSDPLYIAYHDSEWGRPLHDDIKLLEFFVLEQMQAGLSWLTILRKREAFRRAFDGFDPRMVAEYGEEKIDALMRDASIVRNRRKLNAAVNDARLFLNIQREFGSFDKFIWSYVDFEPIIEHPRTLSEVPTTSELSDRISRELKKMGFTFVGSTIIYSFMQAIGMVNDHLEDCSFKMR